MIGEWNVHALKNPLDKRSTTSKRINFTDPSSPLEGRNSVAALRAPEIPSRQSCVGPHTFTRDRNFERRRCPSSRPSSRANATIATHDATSYRRSRERGRGWWRRVWTSSCITTIEIFKRPHRCGAPRILWISARSAFETREYHILVPAPIRWFSYRLHTRARVHLTRVHFTCEF